MNEISLRNIWKKQEENCLEYYKQTKWRNPLTAVSWLLYWSDSYETMKVTTAALEVVRVGRAWAQVILLSVAWTPLPSRNTYKHTSYQSPFFHPYDGQLPKARVKQHLHSFHLCAVQLLNTSISALSFLCLYFLMQDLTSIAINILCSFPVQELISIPSPSFLCCPTS